MQTESIAQPTPEETMPQTAVAPQSSTTIPNAPRGAHASPLSAYAGYQIIRRNGVVRVICTDPRHKQRQG